MKLRDIELKCPKPNVYMLSRVADGADIPLLVWNSKTVRVYCESIKNKGDVISINNASESFKLGIAVARLQDKIKVRQVQADGSMAAVASEPRVQLERIFPGKAVADA